MNNWVVAVKRRDVSLPLTKRVFVENIEYADEAERLALLKLGASPHEHETRSDVIDEKVSVEHPDYNPEKLYRDAQVDLLKAQNELRELEALIQSYSERAEVAERNNTRLERVLHRTETDLNFIRAKLDDIQKGLGARKGIN